MPWFHVIMNSPLLFALLAMVVISAIGQSEENASARPIILDEIEASIETTRVKPRGSARIGTAWLEPLLLRGLSLCDSGMAV